MKRPLADFDNFNARPFAIRLALVGITAARAAMDRLDSPCKTAEEVAGIFHVDPADSVHCEWQLGGNTQFATLVVEGIGFCFAEDFIEVVEMPPWLRGAEALSDFLLQEEPPMTVIPFLASAEYTIGDLVNWSPEARA